MEFGKGQLVLSKAFIVSCQITFMVHNNITLLVGNDSLVYEVSVRSKLVKKSFSLSSYIF